MSDLRDLMNDVATDLDAVRWPTGDELRRRVRRRRRRTMAAVAGAVVAVTAGTVALAGLRAGPPPAPPVAPVPSEVPDAAFLTADVTGAGPDSWDDSTRAGQPVRTGELGPCAETVPSEPVAARGVNHMVGSVNGPPMPRVFSQQVYVFTDAESFMRDLRSTIGACGGVTVPEEGVVGTEGVVQLRITHTWTVIEGSSTGADSLVVRHDTLARRAADGRKVGTGLSTHVIYVRAGNLVTRVEPIRTADLAEVQRFEKLAATRLCETAGRSC